LARQEIEPFWKNRARISFVLEGEAESRAARIFEVLAVMLR
jgi:hypothetical protein